MRYYYGDDYEDDYMDDHGDGDFFDGLDPEDVDNPDLFWDDLGNCWSRETIIENYNNDEYLPDILYKGDGQAFLPKHIVEED